MVVLYYCCIVLYCIDSLDMTLVQMERHATELEHEVDKQMKQFMYERQRSADLLSVMLPK